MGRMINSVAALASAAVLAATPLPAMANPQVRMDAQSAEQLRQLDIMLMVTQLHCRRGSHAFGAEYDRFSANHLPVMRAANRQLRRSYAAGRSNRAQRRMMDTLSTSMANRYGLGHPWMECAELRELAGELASTDSLTILLAAADEVLADEQPVRVSMEARWTDR